MNVFACQPMSTNVFSYGQVGHFSHIYIYIFLIREVRSGLQSDVELLIEEGK
jgi:hypothetical protein